MQPSQQHVASCVKGVERRLGTRGLRMVAAFLGRHPGRGYTGGLHCHRDTLLIALYDTQGNGGRILPQGLTSQTIEESTMSGEEKMN